MTNNSQEDQSRESAAWRGANVRCRARSPAALAFALAASAAAGAQAQSSISVFGLLDVGVMYIKNGDVSRKLQSIDGSQTSRLGFRGVEDLGGGLSASFHLEGALSPDDGNAGGYNFRRRSTVSLNSVSLGELRLGRDYTPTFWNYSVQFSPFGTNGVGSSGNILYGFGGKSSTAPTIVRSDNSIGYFLPRNLGGLYGQAMVAPSEGAPAGKFVGARLGYAGGGFDVAVAASETVNAPNGDKFKSYNIGAAYDFKIAKVMAIYNVARQDVRKQNSYLVGAIVPIGVGEMRLSYARADLVNSPNDASQLALGYLYNLSRRTALYSTASRIDNKGSATFTIPTTNAPPQPAGRKSTGIEAGIRHSF